MSLFGKKQKTPAGRSAATPTVSRTETTYFGKNLKINGSVSGEGSLIILGSLEGEFDLKGQLTIAQGARIKGEVKATDISVNGNVEGTVAALEKIHLDTTARVKGRIRSPKVSVLEGALFDGEMEMTGKSAESSQPWPAGRMQIATASAVGDKK